MRRSSSVLLGAIALTATAATLEGCDDHKTVYRDAAACSLDNDAGLCRASFEAARKAWLLLPGYASRSDCDLGEGGGCVSALDGKWRSPMVGFTLDGRQPVEYSRDKKCRSSGDDARDCTDGGSGGHVFYAGNAFLRTASSSSDGVVVAEPGSRTRGSAADDTETAVDRGGFGGAAEAHADASAGHASGGHGSSGGS